MKRQKKPKAVKFDDALRDLYRAIDRLKRETGGEFRMVITWEPSKEPAANGKAAP